MESLQSTNTRYLVSENRNLADVDILLSATTYFNDNIRSRTNSNNSHLSKENINFQVEYKDSKCSLIQTNFFEIVQQDNIEDSESKSVIGFIIFIIIAIILSNCIIDNLVDYKIDKKSFRQKIAKDRRKQNF